MLERLDSIDMTYHGIIRNRNKDVENENVPFCLIRLEEEIKLKLSNYVEDR